MNTLPRVVDVNLHDTQLGIWQDDARDPSFRAEVYGGLIRHLRSRGWTIGRDPHIKRNYPILSSDHRLGRRGTLRVSIQVSGRVVQMKVWAETWSSDKPDGHRYDFGKRQRLDYLDRLRLEIEERRIISWLSTIATIRSVRRPGLDVRPGALSAMALIEQRWSESFHADKALGRPICRHSSDAASADRGTVTHGATVWFADRKGRIRRGTAYYNINSMWWVVSGPWSLDNLSSSAIFVRPPDALRRKRNDRDRRGRLEAELSLAIRRMQFRRAETLKQLLFGDEAACLIWSRKNGAYYGPQCRGYTSDASQAGRYTRAEAEAEVRRVPHLLELVTPDGERLRSEAAA